jgi:hypothetical protein
MSNGLGFALYTLCIVYAIFSGEVIWGDTEFTEL